MHRIKEFLQKKKGLGPVAALVLLAAVLGLAIALRAGKLENMFDPDSFVTQEEQKEEFDPREYGLEEDGRKQWEEDTTREEETRQQESSREIPGGAPGPPPGSGRRGRAGGAAHHLCGPGNRRRAPAADRRGTGAGK